MILGLSFHLYHRNKFHLSVNDTTNKLALAKAMVQLRKFIKRMVAHMDKNRKHPFKLCKLDIKDGF